MKKKNAVFICLVAWLYSNRLLAPRLLLSICSIGIAFKLVDGARFKNKKVEMCGNYVYIIKLNSSPNQVMTLSVFVPAEIAYLNPSVIRCLYVNGKLSIVIKTGIHY